MAREKLKGFEEALLEVRKVTKVTTGGRRMRFRAIVLVGDRAGHIGIGIGKGNDVSAAVSKATNDAYKSIHTVAITNDGSVPYMVTAKYKACSVVLRPAGPGTGLKAGSSVRTTLELAGFSNILSKIIGSNNPLNNTLATINAITSFKVKQENIKSVKEVEKELIDEDDKSKKRGGKRKPSSSDKKSPRKTTESTPQTKKSPSPAPEKTPSEEKPSEQADNA